MPTPSERATKILKRIPNDEDIRKLIETEIIDAIRDDRKERENEQVRQAAPLLLDLVRLFMKAATPAELAAAQQQGYGVLRMAGDG